VAKGAIIVRRRERDDEVRGHFFASYESVLATLQRNRHQQPDDSSDRKATYNRSEQ